MVVPIPIKIVNPQSKKFLSDSWFVDKFQFFQNFLSKNVKIAKFYFYLYLKNIWEMFKKYKIQGHKFQDPKSNKTPTRAIKQKRFGRMNIFRQVPTTFVLYTH